MDKTSKAWVGAVALSGGYGQAKVTLSREGMERFLRATKKEAQKEKNVRVGEITGKHRIRENYMYGSQQS